MYSSGHGGISLTLYAPLLFIFLAFDMVATGVLGAVVVMFLASTPDVDTRFQFKSTIFHKLPLVWRLVPNIKHRGITHSVWFMWLLGAILAFVGFFVHPLLDPVLVVGRLEFTVLFGFFGFFGIFAHMAGDYITPSGINIFYPYGDVQVFTVHSSNRILFGFRSRDEVRGDLRDNGVLTTASSPIGNYLAGLVGIISIGIAIGAVGTVSVGTLTLKEAALLFSGLYLTVVSLPILISQWREVLRYLLPV